MRPWLGTGVCPGGKALASDGAEAVAAAVLLAVEVVVTSISIGGESVAITEGGAWGETEPEAVATLSGTPFPDGAAGQLIGHRRMTMWTRVEVAAAACARATAGGGVGFTGADEPTRVGKPAIGDFGDPG